jgi:hypothetical protein
VADGCSPATSDELALQLDSEIALYITRVGARSKVVRVAQDAGGAEQLLQTVTQAIFSTRACRGAFGR